MLRSHEIIVLGRAAALARSVFSWEAPRLHDCLLKDNQGEQTGWHAPRAHCCPVRCSVLQGCSKSYPWLSWDSRISLGKQPELGPAWCWELWFLFNACKH